MLDYRREPWDTALRSIRGTRIDRVLDLVGGRDIEAAGRRILGPDGTFVTVVGPERFIGDRALCFPAVLAILACVGLHMMGSSSNPFKRFAVRRRVW